ncbi:ABC transporter substrate-binding protein [Halorussus litoreus]|uniref:ABC transporter substrate-binding protein n=1 Tax=Halorussus litoreus TaxID=1710536 RepID=UPI000E24F3C1|nr:ABC transporter substrate-binding protein [Halorussus litoreus]
MTDTDNLSRRRFLQATGGAASAVALAGCTGDQDDSGNETTTESSDGVGQPPEGENILRLINSTMTTIDPIRATDTASGTVIQQVFDALMNYPNGEIQVENQLAAGHEVSDDFTTYTFELKEGATFHNGDEVTADDFVYSWERLAASDKSRRAYFILDSIGVEHEMETVTKTTKEGEEEEVEQYKPGSMAVEAVDEYTIEINLSSPFHATMEMLAYTSFAVVPEGIVGDIEGYEGKIDHSEFATENPIGAGPFEFESWESNNEAEVSKFDDYHGEAASVDGVHWNIMSDSEAMHTYGTVNQNADMIINNQLPTGHYDPKKVNVEETDDLGRQVGTYGETTSGATMDYTGFATVSAYYMGFNTDAVDKPVRQAAAYAMNQKEAVDSVFKGRGDTSYHFTPPSIYPGGAPAYREHAENKYPYGYDEEQLDQARQVMEDAGYGDDNRASFTFTVYESSDTWPQLGQLLRDKLTSVYIDMEIETAPFSTLTERGRSGNLEAYSLGWAMDWPAPDNFLQLLNPPLTDTSKDAPISYFNWSGTDAAEQATQAWETIQNNPAPTEEDQSARGEAYVQMEEANWEDMCLLPTYHQMDERFKYQWVDCPKFGGAQTSRQMYNTVSLNERN